MTVFRNVQELQNVLSRLWAAIFDSPEIMSQFGGMSMAVEFRFTDYQTRLVVAVGDGRKDVLWDPPASLKADVEMILTSDVGHAFWMERLNIPMALASRDIVAKGSFQKALKLLPALKPAFALYPRILAELGRQDLLQSGSATTRKKRFTLPKLFQSGHKLHLERLPAFPSIQPSACARRPLVPSARARRRCSISTAVCCASAPLNPTFQRAFATARFRLRRYICRSARRRSPPACA